MFDVVAIGEVLIDFTPSGISENGNALFEKNPGGAPANVLAAVAKLGGKTSFIGKVGDDYFGHFLYEVLRENGVGTEGLIYSETENTTLAFVHLDDQGDRSFSFYRKPGADMMLQSEDIKEELIEGAKVFHFGSVSMTDDPSRSATLKAVQKAKEKDCIISYDPNLRPPLWNNLKTAKKVILEGMKYADIVKISEEELEFLTDIKDLKEGSQKLIEGYSINMLFVTLGSKGCFYRVGKMIGNIPGFTVRVMDTTGAGDAFLGGILYQVLSKGKKLDQFVKEDVEQSIRFANGIGALVTTKKGAIPAMPTLEEVQGFIQGQ